MDIPRITMAIMRPMQLYYDKQTAIAQGRESMRRFVVCILFVMIVAVPASSGPVFDQAIEAFRYDRTEEAISLFQSAIQNEPNQELAHRYLGIAYEQSRQWDRAESVYRRGLESGSVSPAEKARIAAQLASLYQRQGRYEEALGAYSSAVQYDSALAAAYLNRANVKVNLEEFESAVNDYRTYLSVKPDSWQRPQIEQMISLLTTEVQKQREEEEARRRAAEEQQRREEERRQREEEQRRALLNSVLDSLNTAGTETENLKADAEEIQNYEEDLDIID